MQQWKSKPRAIGLSLPRNEIGPLPDPGGLRDQ
jgi:hypothetical protein